MWADKMSTGDMMCMGITTTGVVAFFGGDWRPCLAIACYAFALSLARFITAQR